MFPSDVVDSIQTMTSLYREVQPLKDLMGIMCMHVRGLAHVCVPSEALCDRPH